MFCQGIYDNHYTSNAAAHLGYEMFYNIIIFSLLHRFRRRRRWLQLHDCLLGRRSIHVPQIAMLAFT